MNGISLKRAIIAVLLTLYFMEGVLTDQAFSAVGETNFLTDSWKQIDSSISSSTLESATDTGFSSFVGNVTSGLQSNGTIINVSTPTEFAAALKQVAATGGEIVLAPGDYNSVNISRYNPSEPVVIRSADPENPAHFEDIKVGLSSNLVFDGLDVGRGLKEGEHSWTKLFDVNGSSNIAVVNTTIHGSEDGDYDNDGYGIQFRDCTSVVFENNELHDLVRGAIFYMSSDIEVIGNFVHDLRSDGLDFAGVEHVTIEENYLRDFRPNIEAGDHADFIQFWTTNAGDSKDVVIRNNALIEGEGGIVQGIFIEGKTVGYDFYDFTIEGNLYHGSSTHGITVYEMHGATIQNNTLVGTEDSPFVTSIVIQGEAENVVVANNVAMGYHHPELATVFENNVTAQYDELNSPTHVENLFINALAGENLEVADLIPRADGLLAQNQVGALVDTIADISILTNQSTGSSDSLSVSFSAHENDGDDALGSAVSYRWTFSDGTVIDGENVKRTFATGGEYSVTLDAMAADGSVLRSVDKVLKVVDPLLFSLDFENGVNDVSAAERDGAWTGTESYVDGPTGSAGQFDSSKASSVVVDDTSNLTGMSELTVEFDLQLGDGAESGNRARPVWYHANYGVEIVNGTDINAFVWTGEGTTNILKIKGLDLNDDAWHHLSMSYSSEQGLLLFQVDGNEVGRLEGLSGNVANHIYSDLIIGSGPYADAFDGSIDNVKIYQSFIEDLSHGVEPVFEQKFDNLDNGFLEVNEATKFAAFDDSALFGSAADDDEMSVFVDIKSDGPINQQQRLLWNHQEYGISLQNDDLTFWLFDSEDKLITKTVKAAGVADGDWHQVGFSLDEQTGHFVGYVDEKNVIEMDDSGAELHGQRYWDLDLGGTPWGNQFAGSLDNLTVFDVAIAPTDYNMITDSGFGSMDHDALIG